jgi:site-specific recombinase XerD
MFIAKKKSGFYHLFYHIDGQRKSISTKSTKKNEALQFLKDFEITSKQRIEVKLFPSITNFLRANESRLRKSTIKHYNCFFKEFKSYFENISVDQINQQDLQTYLNKKAKISNYSANGHRAYLSSFFQYLIDNRIIEVNPLVKIKKYPIPKKTPIYIPQFEIDKIIESEPNQVFKNLYLFAYNTGMRRSEIINLKWNDIEEGFIFIRCNSDFQTKTNEERVIPINETLNKILLAQKPKILELTKNQFVFTVNNEAIREDLISKKFKRLVRKLKLNESFKFHSLRGSFLTNLVKVTDLSTAMKLTGHKQLSTVQKHYLSSQMGDVIKAMDKIGKVM